MPVTLSEITPTSTHLSGNPIRVKATTTGIPPGASHYRILLKIYSINDVIFGSPFVDAIAPREDGTAWFNISGYVDQPIRAQFTFPLAGFVRGWPFVHGVHLQAGESYIDGQGQRVESWFDSVGPLFVINGKIDEHELALYNERGTSWFEEWVAQGRFLTRMPPVQVVHPYQPVKLWIKWPLQSLAECQVYLGYLYSDGTLVETLREVTLFGDHLFEMDLQPAHLGVEMILASGASLQEYTVRWEAGGYSSPVQRYVVDYTRHKFCNFLLFRNPIGGIDVVWLSGAAEPGHTTTMVQAKRPQPHGAGLLQHTVVTNRSSRLTWNINTGYKSPEEMASLVDLMRSEQVWLLWDAHNPEQGALYPVVVNNSEDILCLWDADIHDLDLELIMAH